MTDARLYLCRLVGVERCEISNYLTVTKVVEMPDLGLCCWFEVLCLKHISQREWPNRRGASVRD